MHVESARIFKKIFHRTLSRAGFPERTVTIHRRNDATGELRQLRRQRPHIRFHDLRHTFASHWVMKGGDVFKLQKILGHSSIQMTMRYAHLAPHAFSNDYSRFGSGLPSQQDAAMVVPLTQKSSAR